MLQLERGGDALLRLGESEAGGQVGGQEGGLLDEHRLLSGRAAGGVRGRRGFW